MDMQLYWSQQPPPPDVSQSLLGLMMVFGFVTFPRKSPTQQTSSKLPHSHLSSGPLPLAQWGRDFRGSFLPPCLSPGHSSIVTRQAAALSQRGRDGWGIIHGMSSLFPWREHFLDVFNKNDK